MSEDKKTVSGAIVLSMGVAMPANALTLAGFQLRNVKNNTSEPARHAASAGKPGVIEYTCRTGIRVVMFTGGNARTAEDDQVLSFA